MSKRIRIVIAATAALLVVGVAGVALAAPSPGWGAMMDGRSGTGGMMNGSEGMMSGDRERMRDWHDEMWGDSERMRTRHDGMHTEGDMWRHMERGRGDGGSGTAGQHCPGGFDTDE